MVAEADDVAQHIAENEAGRAEAGESEADLTAGLRPQCQHPVDTVHAITATPE